MKRPSLLQVTMVLPLLGVVGMMLNSQHRSSTGSVWRVEISGYDPRDLIHGQYLRYTYRLPTMGDDVEDFRGLDGEAPDPEILVCFVRNGKEVMTFRIADTIAERQGCGAWTPRANLVGPKKFLVPEDRGKALEDALRAHRAEVDLVIDRRGGTAVNGLYLDGRPWREVLDEKRANP